MYIFLKHTYTHADIIILTHTNTKSHFYALLLANAKHIHTHSHRNIKFDILFSWCFVTVYFRDDLSSLWINLLSRLFLVNNPHYTHTLHRLHTHTIGTRFPGHAGCRLSFTVYANIAGLRHTILYLCKLKRRK